ncbi:coiled-coil domain-containing protein R3HCC1L-like [Ctenocephalides felis]|nr:coiled-coil domain-containing protein R3HCC1L-like isoform X2 [Ctenocephalides felis]XP_026473351.1 coiled-coil domain-containing protein R3HCC1L-like isoform X2 [Ctenocephalides felis]XP_026473871.1 coiled-coil domain-containing protein R3HCC1L-like [Ctenocephalides felis]XP_026475848.1 coiled-coil domain-containing protein R3HCC1L-like [Ctenocephalides felis]
MNHESSEYSQQNNCDKLNMYKNKMSSNSNETINVKKSNFEMNGNGDDWKDKLMDEDRDLFELQRASEEINRSNRRIMKQSFRSDVLIISDEQKERKSEPTKSEKKTIENKRNVACTKEEPIITVPKSTHYGTSESHKINPEEDDWEAMYDENGDCLDSKLWEDLTHMVGKATISPQESNSEKSLQNKDKSSTISDDSFAHVLEIYDFPAEFKTQDLLSVFSPYKSTGFEIKWVDDTHALAVFSSVQIAQEALSQDLPFVKTRPLREGTSESRQKARRCAEFLQPYRTRPETCPALARRLVSGALGLRLKTAAADLERERLLLKEAKERKLLAIRQRDEAWEQEYTTRTGK